MSRIADRLLQSAACCRNILEVESLNKIHRFVLSCQAPDGGFRGRDGRSDLCHTLFAVATLRAIDYPIPLFKVWKYGLSFGVGKDLDLVHLVCLIRLRLAFPILGITRRRLFRQLEKFKAEGSHALLLKLLAAEGALPVGEASIGIPLDASTTRLAAAVLANGRADPGIQEELRSRFVETGGFAPTKKTEAPDLLSTAAALFALVEMEVDLDGMQPPAFKYIESLWRDGGGFAGHAADGSEDVECTFYALLCMGCLIKSMARKHGKKAEEDCDG